MLKRLIKASNSGQGFTLIELLVVIIIIGILASIAVVGISGARTSAYAGQCTANANQLVKALLSHKATNGVFPGESTTTGYAAQATTSALTGRSKLSTAWEFTYAQINGAGGVAPTFLNTPDLPYVGGGTVVSPYYLYASYDTSTNIVSVNTYTSRTIVSPATTLAVYNPTTADISLSSCSARG